MADEPKKPAPKAKKSRPLDPRPPDCRCDYGTVVVKAKGAAPEVVVREHKPNCPVLYRWAKERLAEAERMLAVGDTGQHQMAFPDPVTEKLHADGLAKLEARVTRLRREVSKHEREHRYVK